MTVRKAIALAGLVLALVVLSPASASASAAAKCPASAPAGAEAKCRPMKGIVLATVKLNKQTGSLAADGTLIGTHTGIGPVRLYNGQARPFRLTPPNLVAFELAADVTIVAANGDQLYGHFTGTTEDFVLGAAHRDEARITISGGSGRFDGAHGELNMVIHVGRGTDVVENGATWMVSRSVSTVTGYLVY
jgi:hypothetical protein